MKLTLAFVAIAAAAVVAATEWSHPSPASRSTLPFGQAPPNVFFGHVKSMKRTGNRYELRLDPAWLLKGLTAARAALEDTGSSDVPNDAYTLEAGHRLLTFAVTKDARITILTRRLKRIQISAAELNAIQHGRNPNHRRLFGRNLPFWLVIGERYPDPAVTIDQQYQP